MLEERSQARGLGTNGMGRPFLHVVGILGFLTDN